DVVLSLAKLDRILAHEPADLTLSVGGGATLDGLNAVLGAHRQFLPLDPAHPAISTIGGLIATGAAGPYRARYGTMRDLLLGLTVVRADGTMVKGGGRVVKNVSGYDIPKRHGGALGSRGGGPRRAGEARRGAELGVRLRKRGGGAPRRARGSRHAHRPEPLPDPDRRRAPGAPGIRPPGGRPRRHHRQRARGGPRAERAPRRHRRPVG